MKPSNQKSKCLECSISITITILILILFYFLMGILRVPHPQTQRKKSKAFLISMIKLPRCKTNIYIPLKNDSWNMIHFLLTCSLFKGRHSFILGVWCFFFSPRFGANPGSTFVCSSDNCFFGTSFSLADSSTPGKVASKLEHDRGFETGKVNTKHGAVQISAYFLPNSIDRCTHSRLLFSQVLLQIVSLAKVS